MTSLHIALCGDGRSPHTQRWANEFARRGHRVTVVWRRDQYAVSALDPYDGGVLHESAGGDLDPRRPWDELRSWREARALARRLRPDLVHGLYLRSHGWTARDFGIRPLVLSALGSDVLRLDDPPPPGAYAGAVDRYIRARTIGAARRADVVLCDSADVAERVARWGARTALVRFGVEPPAEDDGGWRARLTIPDGAFVVLSTRLLKENYNIHVLIEAFPAVLERVPAAMLVLKEYEPFSDPEYRGRCRALVEELAVEHAVRWVGELDPPELRRLYAAADVYASVPSTDGTAVSVFEAMAAGVPVVATRALGIDESVLRDGETAVLVDPGDREGLAGAIVALAADAGERARLQAAGRAVYEAVGSAEREFDEAERIYLELAGRLS